ncbi:hypothetical protein SDC9_71903 [bioreactor metagenome]|uniref:Uncharacterized protein n=1 Tax=bioreactor metagenome TaxID=1076179 RepID=A0A644YAR7_9ZZZZ
MIEVHLLAGVEIVPGEERRHDAAHQSDDGRREADGLKEPDRSVKDLRGKHIDPAVYHPALNILGINSCGNRHCKKQHG